MEWYFIVLIVLGSIIVLYVLISLLGAVVCTGMLTNPRRWKRIETENWNKEHDLYEDYCDILKTKDVIYKMDDGYEIHGYEHIVPGSKKFVIMVHGHGVNNEAERYYTVPFLNMGFSVILFDDRGQGDNKVVPVTMGYNEAKDLKKIIDIIYEKYGKDIELGLHGVSMGSATVMMVTQYTQNLKFIIADCGYSSLKQLGKDKIKEFHLPTLLTIPFIDGLLKAKYGFSIKDVEPATCLKNNEIPMCFIHGTEDRFVHYKNLNMVYEANKGYKEKHSFLLATHANSIQVDKARYYKDVTNFVSKFVK